MPPFLLFGLLAFVCLFKACKLFLRLKVPAGEVPVPDTLPFFPLQSRFGTGFFWSTLLAYSLFQDPVISLQRELKTATMVYKSLNGLAPEYLKSMFTDRSSTTTYSLRNCEGKLALPLPRTNFLKNSFSFSGAVLWNSLPTNLRQAQTLASFKSGCRSFLFDND